MLKFKVAGTVIATAAAFLAISCGTENSVGVEKISSESMEKTAYGYPMDAIDITNGTVYTNFGCVALDHYAPESFTPISTVIEGDPAHSIDVHSALEYMRENIIETENPECKMIELSRNVIDEYEVLQNLETKAVPPPAPEEKAISAETPNTPFKETEMQLFPEAPVALPAD